MENNIIDKLDGRGIVEKQSEMFVQVKKTKENKIDTSVLLSERSLRIQALQTLKC